MLVHEHRYRLLSVAGIQSTGKFAGATGSSISTLSIVEGADVLPGKTTCDISNVGGLIAKGSSLTYNASGPLTLTQ
jgi:hypothetical protein